MWIVNLNKRELVDCQDLRFLPGPKQLRTIVKILRWERNDSILRISPYEEWIWKNNSFTQIERGLDDFEEDDFEEKYKDFTRYYFVELENIEVVQEQLERNNASKLPEELKELNRMVFEVTLMNLYKNLG